MSEAEALIETEPEVDDNCPAVLRITPSGIKAEFKNKSGNKIFKNISVASLSRVLNKDSEFDSGFLPLYGTNYMGIKRYIKAGDRDILFIEASPHIRDVMLFEEGNVIPGVRFPGLLMSVVCRMEAHQARVTDTRLFATKGPILRETDQLYRFPFGNVYNDAHICWGSLDGHSNIKTITQAGSLMDVFLSSVMNDDLGNASNTLPTCQNITEYPYDNLSRDNLTYRDLLSLVKSKNVG